MESLLEPGDLELIRILELSARRRLAGQATGEQRSPTMGGGIEFADYREYVPGDDVRQVDWSVFLRFRKLLVKLCAEEKELTLMVLVDTSASMAYGSPTKLRTAQRIAAVLGGIALASGNRAGLLSWGGELTEVLAPLRGSREVPRFGDRVSRLEAGSENRPQDCARAFATRYHRRCLAVLVTDLLHPDWDQALAGLAASDCEAHVVQVLAPEEWNPPFRGEVTLVDQERGTEAPLLVDFPLLERYRAEVDRWTAEVASQCRAAGLGYTLVRSDGPLPHIFLEEFRKAGLVC
jgi:uncharacterized protein (DUF58 family)